MKKQINSEKKIDVILFTIIFLSGSFLTSNDIVPPVVTKGVWILLAFTLFYMGKYKVKNIINNFLLVGTLIVSVGASALITRSISTATLFFFVGIILSFLFICNWSFDTFRESYIRILKFLSIFSLIMMLLFIIIPGIMNNLFVVNNINGFQYCNFLFFSRLRNEAGIGRNCGMFWEPGAFQTFLSIALLLEVSKEMPSTKNITLFIVTILTTFSTTGYFVLVLFFLYFIFGKYKEKKRIRILSFIIIILVIAFMFLKREYFFSISNYSTFGKLILYSTSSAYHNRVSSVSIRKNSIIQPIIIFLNNPIFGVGEVTFRQLMVETTLGVTTCTFANWFAIYGVFPGIILVGGALKLAQKLDSSLFGRAIFFAILFLSTATENYVSSTIICLILLYGLLSTYVTEKC